MLKCGRVWVCSVPASSVGMELGRIVSSHSGHGISGSLNVQNRYDMLPPLIATND